MKKSPTKENLSEYRFLTNKPLGEDLFKNESQKKIASVICKKIINEPDFKIIGIDGTWGSGKSNLVKIIENELKDSHKFFIYDVWGHQEDEQRRAILVELTEFIKNEKGLLKPSKKNWDLKLKELLANSKETITINQPYLSVGFIFSLLSIVYIPTVNVFKDSLKDFFNIESLFWKLILVAFPLFIVLGIYIYNLIRNWIHSKGILKSFRISAEETFQIYTNKQKEETKIETISENQPSVRDFQKWMRDIDEDLNKKVVLVFDNFDRLPKKHILNIWSSIHIFFAEKKYDNIKVILPFDREHIQNAFKELNSDTTNKTFGDDYVNKTFDIVFRVTLPIMSDWKQFFQNQWQLAFAKYNEDELKLVIQVYEFLNTRITPREIIVFINEILTIKLLDQNFKERYIAIFILKKDEILIDSLRAITDLSYLNGLKSIYHKDPDFGKQLTAIVYHIEVENALELIYTQQLKDSMNKNNVEQFNNICKSEFVDAIFTGVINEIEVLENPILTLAQLDDATNLSPLHIDQAWGLFYDKVIAQNLVVKDIAIEDWEIKIIQKISDDQYLKNRIDGYLSVLNETNTLDYVEVIDKLFDEVGEDRVSALLTKHEILPKNLIEVVERKNELFDKYQLQSHEKEIDAYLSSLPIEDLLNIKVTDVLNKSFNLTEYKEFLKTNLKIYIDQNNVKSSNDVLIKLKETTTINAGLMDVLNDDEIYTLFSNASSSTLPIMDDLLAMRIAIGVSFNRSYVGPFEELLNDDNKAFSNKISLIILNYIKYDDLLLQAKFFTSSALFKNLVVNLIKNDEINKEMNSSKLIAKYGEIKTSLSIEEDLLLKEIDNYEVDKNELVLDDLDDDFIKDCFSYEALEVSRIFIEKFNEDFSELNEESYKIVFGDGSDVHFKYFGNLNLSSLTQSSLDAFEEQILTKIKEGKLSDQWWSILAKYESNNSNLSIINTLKNIRDEFFTSSLNLDIQTANELLPYFIKYKLLEDNSDVFRKIIKNEFLIDEKFCAILKSNGEHVKSLYQKAHKDEKDGFRHTINEKREDLAFLEELAKLIGIRRSNDS